MKKPKWYIIFRLKNDFSFRLWTYFNKQLLWKDKYDTPRVEILPKYLFSWLWFQLDIVQGNEKDWEWHLWVTKYSDNDIQKAIDTYPWGHYDENKNFIRGNPHLN